MILLRVELLDIPGALANAAAAIASTGTDIASIRIVGRTDDDTVVDDFICELAPDVLPDGLVSALPSPPEPTCCGFRAVLTSGTC